MTAPALMLAVVVSWLGAAEPAGPRAFRVELHDLNPQLPLLTAFFDHPGSLGFEGRKEHVIALPGHAGLHLSGVLVGRAEGGREATIVVNFFDLARQPELRKIDRDPRSYVLKVASAQAENPYLGLVGKATDMSRPRTVQGRDFAGAELEFKAPSGKAAAPFAGRALELYFPVFKVQVSVQMVGREAAFVAEALDRLVASLRLEPSSEPAKGAATGPMNFCRSDQDCWCKVFTGAGFVPGRNPWHCDPARGRCEPCTYE